MKANPLPSLEYLNECFEIDSSLESGLRWKERPLKHFSSKGFHRMFSLAFANKMAGCKQADYFKVTLSFRNYKKQRILIHRIIYAIKNNTIDFEDKVVDHIDRNKLNNNVDNLRLVNKLENCYNSNLYKTNTSGHKGVYLDKKTKKWSVEIYFNNQKYDLGSYKSLEKAVSFKTLVDLEISSRLFKNKDRSEIQIEIRSYLQNVKTASHC